jgi:hypothetical protein
MTGENTRRFGIALAVVGLALIAAYLNTVLGFFSLPEHLMLMLVFAIAPVAIYGVLSFEDRLAGGERPSRTLRAATVFLSAGFVLFELMLVVQQYVRMRMAERIEAAPGVAEAEALRQLRSAVDLVQQGIDVTWDIFYCVGMVLLAAVMFRHRDFGRWIGGFGIVAGAALLVLNMAAFPHIPADSGLIDLGPVTALWWVVVILNIVRLDRRDRRAESVG